MIYFVCFLEHDAWVGMIGVMMVIVIMIMSCYCPLFLEFHSKIHTKRSEEYLLYRKEKKCSRMKIGT